MKIDIKNFSKNLNDAMRSAGYHFEGTDTKTGEWKYYRSVSSNLFPRFHIYCLADKAKKLTVSLHLDQKAPVYQGNIAHSGDYEGPVIDAEIAKLKAALVDAAKLPQMDSMMDL
ncbi:MAG: hypothetical protein Q8L24_01750 [bacterium]|nr:hypothetical protein [bacterium]